MALARKRSRPPAAAKARRRRTAEEARRVILDAAEKRLREGGPDAIRLKDIARDAGIAHPTILHHFESRDGLTRALQMRAMDRLEAALHAVLETAPATEDTAVGVLERISATLADAGHARLLAWRVLGAAAADEGEEDEPTLRRLADLVHERRRALRREPGLRRVSREDSEFLVRLTASAMLGDGLLGDYLDHWIGRSEDADARRRYRVWFARLLLEHMRGR